jgi:predicted RNase H-like nuclease
MLSLTNLKNTSDILIVGVDPAPGKGSTAVEVTIKNGQPSITLCKGKEVLSTKELCECFEEWNSKSSVLMAWDAPLTGPSDIEKPWNDHSLTRRKIEALFAKENDKIAGISVQGYGSCPHWTISQRMLGLPKLHPAHKGGDFTLVGLDSDKSKLTGNRHVVEVHPAVAIWQWLQKTDKGWRYKGTTKENKSIRAEFCDRLSEKWKELDLDVGPLLAHAKKSDDVLDALTAAVLGYMWVSKDNEVALVGNIHTGAWLVPDNAETKEWGQSLMGSHN